MPLSNSHAWYAIQTRSRHERKVLKELAGLSLETYLPQYQTWSRRKDRRKKIQKPLFPGYLFVHTELTPKRRLTVLQADSVVRILGIGARPVPIPDEQIQSVQIMLNSAKDAGPHQPLEKGQLVQVMEGPLRGVVGMVDNSLRQKIVVHIELLGRAVAATLETDQLVPFLEPG